MSDSCLDLLSKMEELISRYARDEDGVFGHHVFCAWFLFPGRHYRLLMYLVEDLLRWPNRRADLYDALYERISSEYSHDLGVCEETRQLLLVHIKGMIQNRPRE